MGPRNFTRQIYQQQRDRYFPLDTTLSLDIEVTDTLSITEEIIDAFFIAVIDSLTIIEDTVFTFSYSEIVADILSSIETRTYTRSFLIDHFDTLILSEDIDYIFDTVEIIANSDVLFIGEGITLQRSIRNLSKSDSLNIIETKTKIFWAPLRELVKDKLIIEETMSMNVILNKTVIDHLIISNNSIPHYINHYTVINLPAIEIIRDMNTPVNVGC